MTIDDRHTSAPSSPASSSSNRNPNSNRKSNRWRSRGNRRNGHNFTKVIGVTGLKHIAGRINEEYLTSIKRWQTEVKLYIEMKDDPLLATLLDAIKVPLLAAPFDIEPVSEDPQDQAAADWLWDNLNAMTKQTWISHVEDALECIDFGFFVGAINLEKRTDGRIWLKNIEPRGQETLYEWVFDDDNKGDQAVIFRQQDPNGSGTIFPIPLSQCLHIVYRGRKGNPQGKSLLRGLYRTYKFVRNLEDLEAIGVERDIGGMPVAKLKEGDLSEEDMTDLKKTLRNLRKDEEVYLIEPADVDIRPWAGGNKIYDANQIIERYQKLTLMRFFAQFLKLGMDNIGTQALVRGSHDFFTLAIEGVQRYLLEAWNQQLVPYLFNWNLWTGLTDYPRIVWMKPGKPDLSTLINFLNTAIGAKLLTPTDVDEDHIRTLADLPDLPEEERGAPRDVEQPAMPGLFDLPRRLDDIEKSFKVFEVNSRNRDTSDVSQRLRRLENVVLASERGR